MVGRKVVEGRAHGIAEALVEAACLKAGGIESGGTTTPAAGLFFGLAHQSATDTTQGFGHKKQVHMKLREGRADPRTALDLAALRLRQRASGRKSTARPARCFRIKELTEMKERLAHLARYCTDDARPECLILEGLAGEQQT